MAFPSRAVYEQLIYSLPDSYPEIRSSTLHLYTNSPSTCFVRGSVWLRNGLELRVFEYLDFADGELLDYRYAIYHGEEPIRWYDAQPHPELPELASTFPHHQHEPPDPSTGRRGEPAEPSGQSIKHHRRPAPGISFHAPNLPTLIGDCIALSPS